MNEMRLARYDLGQGWIDLGYGEPVVVRDVLMNDFITPGIINFPNGAGTAAHAIYQPPQGSRDFVALLEKKYDAKVVVTNGAKQGIAAVMYALKKLGHSKVVIPSPYWTSHPTLITDQGLDVENLDSSKMWDATACMITSPNNPDGREATKAQFKMLSEHAKKDNCVLVHDAAYYTPIYMAKPDQVSKVGDVQVYSFSKMWGLSGLRLGYVVIHNEKLLPHVIEFIERSCSGVSVASQEMGYQVEKYFMEWPQYRDAFERKARAAIAKSRRQLKKLDPEVLEVIPCKSNSMFAWCKAGPKLDYKAAKVNLLPGDIFGAPGFIRMNIAVDSDLIKNAVERLNNAGKNNDANSKDKTHSDSSTT